MAITKKMIKKALENSHHDSNGVINAEDAIERIYDLIVCVFPEQYRNLHAAEKLKKRKDGFYDTLLPFLDTYTKEMIREFFDYWSETNRSKTKMLFEQRSTWELSKRLKRWANQSNKTCVYRKPATHPFSEKFDKTWARWKKYKADEFKYYYNSDDSEQSAMNQLISLSKGNEDVAVKIVSHSIASGYRIFTNTNGEKEQKDDSAKFKDAGYLLKILGG